MRAYLALGSNLGDREQHLRDAIDAIPDRVDVSSVWETDPVGGPSGQGPFLNLVVALETNKSPRELLAVAQSLEAAAGRVRDERWGPRTLDVDVILVGDLEVHEPDLVVPHPLWRERAFVVEPLREVADAALLAQLPTDLDTSGVRKAPSLWGDFDTALRPSDVAKWFEGFDGVWAIAGGWAIELFVGGPVRGHKDIDIVVARVDVPKLPDQLVGWELFFPAPGGFTPWQGGDPVPDEQHQFWCRPSPDAPWSLEVLFEDIRDGVLHYRRDPSVTVPVTDAILRTPQGIPYVAPQLQLLYKAKANRPRDDADRAAAIPRMTPEQRAWLDAHLP